MICQGSPSQWRSTEHGVGHGPTKGGTPGTVGVVHAGAMVGSWYKGLHVETETAHLTEMCKYIRT